MGLAFLSGANPFLFFLERKESKRKSSADHAFALFKAVCAILLHKTDGSYVNRPFFRFKQDVRESVFSQIDRLSRSVFCFFSSRKEIVPLLFFLEEKTVSLRGKRSPLRRTSSFLFRRKEAKENHLRSSFLSPLLLLSPTCYTKRTVRM